MRLGERPTGDIVMLIMTAVIGFVVLLGATGTMIVEIIHPERDTDNIINLLYDIVKVLIGAIIGFAAGRKAAPETLPAYDPAHTVTTTVTHDSSGGVNRDGTPTQPPR